MRFGYRTALAGLVVVSGLAVLVAVQAEPSDIGEPVDVDDLPVLSEDVARARRRPTGGSAASR